MALKLGNGMKLRQFLELRRNDVVVFFTGKERLIPFYLDYFLIFLSTR